MFWLAGAAALTFTPVLALADAASEVVTAETHATLAVQSSDVAGVHMHLHHVINCLVGPGGKGYDAKELNPCANAGKGAIPDTTDAAKKAALQKAVDMAQMGIDSPDMKAAIQMANQTATMLKAK
jgi:hypothetical protein